MARDLPPTLRESRVTRAEALARTLEPSICRHAADDHGAGDIRELDSTLARMQASTADPMRTSA